MRNGSIMELCENVLNNSAKVWKSCWHIGEWYVPTAFLGCFSFIIAVARCFRVWYATSNQFDGGTSMDLTNEIIKAAVAGEQWATEKVIAHYDSYIEELAIAESGKNEIKMLLPSSASLSVISFQLLAAGSPGNNFHNAGSFPALFLLYSSECRCSSADKQFCNVHIHYIGLKRCIPLRSKSIAQLKKGNAQSAFWKDQTTRRMLHRYEILLMHSCLLLWGRFLPCTDFS